MDSKKTLIAIAILLVLGVGAYFATGKKSEPPTTNNPPPVSEDIKVKGVLVPGGVECQRLQTLDGTYYTISRNNLGDIKEGDQVEVTGKKAEVSFCQQDTTIDVEKIEKLSGTTSEAPTANPQVKSNNSGIIGSVTYGPVCPGPLREDDPKCDDQPYAATISIQNKSGVEITHVTSGKNGVFQVTLVPGEYILQPMSNNDHLNAQPVNVTVVPNQFSKVVIQFDSGIR